MIWTSEECIVKGRKTTVWASGCREIVEDYSNTRLPFCIYFYDYPIMTSPHRRRRFGSIEAAMKWAEKNSVTVGLRGIVSVNKETT